VNRQTRDIPQSIAGNLYEFKIFIIPEHIGKKFILLTVLSINIRDALRSNRISGKVRMQTLLYNFYGY